MQNSTKALLYLAAGAAAIYFYKKYTTPPQSVVDVEQRFRDAGFSQTSTSNGTAFVTSGDTTFGFKQGDFEQLNAAQKILIGVDRFVPGTWLTRAVLT